MPLFALDPERADFYTAWGFWVGVIGTVVGLVGFGVTIWQLVITRRAAEAARTAAEETLAENKVSFERFVAAHAGRYFSELRNAANRGEWLIAEARAHDLADLLAGLPARGAIPAADVLDAVGRLRDFGQVFAEFAAGKPHRKKMPAPQTTDQWRPLLRLLHAQLDQLRAPFRSESSYESGSADPGRDLPPNRPGLGREDEGRTGDLGEARS